MAATALRLSPKPNAIETSPSKVQELTDVFARHSSRFHRIAMGHLRNAADAEDAVQDALLSALTHVHQFRGQAKMSTWLSTIVINSARMKLRRRFARLATVRLTLDESDDPGLAIAEIVSDARPNPEQAYREREIEEILAHASLRLPPTLRRTFQLRSLEGLSIRETADLLGVPAGTVKAQLARARVKLRKAMAKSAGKHGVRCGRDCHR